MIISFKARQALFQRVDSISLGLFRFLFGFLLCVEMFVFNSEARFTDYYIKPPFHFTYPLFDLLGLKPWPAPFLWTDFYLMQISAIGIMLGLFTRASFIVFSLTFGYLFFMESAYYTNHYYLIFLLSFLMCFGHSGSRFSVDALINKKSRKEFVDYWELFLLRFQICIVFFYAGVAKLNEDWLFHALPMRISLIKDFTLFGFPFHPKWLAFFLSWAGMILDLGLGILLFINRWHWLAFSGLCMFNGMNILLFGPAIHTFPYLMMSSYLLFLPTHTVKEFIEKVFKRKVIDQKAI